MSKTIHSVENMALEARLGLNQQLLDLERTIANTTQRHKETIQSLNELDEYFKDSPVYVNISRILDLSAAVLVPEILEFIYGQIKVLNETKQPGGFNSVTPGNLAMLESAMVNRQLTEYNEEDFANNGHWGFLSGILTQLFVDPQDTVASRIRQFYLIRINGFIFVDNNLVNPMMSGVLPLGVNPMMYTPPMGHPYPQPMSAMDSAVSFEGPGFRRHNRGPYTRF